MEHGRYRKELIPKNLTIFPNLYLCILCQGYRLWKWSQIEAYSKTNRGLSQLLHVFHLWSHASIPFNPTSDVSGSFSIGKRDPVREKHGTIVSCDSVEMMTRISTTYFIPGFPTHIVYFTHKIMKEVNIRYVSSYSLV